MGFLPKVKDQILITCRVNQKQGITKPIFPIKGVQLSCRLLMTGTLTCSTSPVKPV
uniref:Uncharacterized protein n=1 Tax=Arundo donax TaxID=35708 RepID=A0A0A8ZKM1_ARUDO